MSMNNTTWPKSYYNNGEDVDHVFIHRFYSQDLGAPYCLVPKNHAIYRPYPELPIIPA